MPNITIYLDDDRYKKFKEFNKEIIRELKENFKEDIDRFKKNWRK